MTLVSIETKLHKMESKLQLKVSMSLTALSLLFLANGCFGFPSGAPEQVCESMMPSHGVQAKPTNTSPFGLNLNAVYYKPGNAVQVTISSKAAGSERFKGLLLQARQVGNNAIGSFRNLPNGTKYLKCQLNEKGAVTHKETLNISSITFEWLPPDSSSLSNVSFYATVVKEKEIFWMKIASEALQRDPSSASTLGFNLMLLFVILAIGWSIQ